MTDTPRKPRGRRPGRADTRATIQRAALALFSSLGYDKVSLRAIARQAEVDPALIHHYFTSKSDLFAQTVLDLPLDADQVVAQVLAGPREEIGVRAVTAFMQAYDSPDGGRERFTAMLRSSLGEDMVHPQTARAGVGVRSRSGARNGAGDAGHSRRGLVRR